MDKDVEVHEEFIGWYPVSSIDSSTLFAVVKDTFLRLNITFPRSGVSAMMELVAWVEEEVV